jgi:hypothetical protein
MNTRRTCTSRTVRGLGAYSPLALEQNSPIWKPRSQPPLSHHGFPKRLELLRKDLGKIWSVPRGCYAPKLGSSNEINQGSIRNPSIGGRPQSLGDQDQAQRWTKQVSMIPTNKSEPKHFGIEGTSHAQKTNENSSKKETKIQRATNQESTQL